MVGFADYSTPTGWYHGEVLSITGPAVFAIVTVGTGVALATEERGAPSRCAAAPISGAGRGAKLAARVADRVVRSASGRGTAGRSIRWACHGREQIAPR